MIACAIRRKHQSPCGGRGQKSVTHHHTGNGAELTANGHVSPQALWQHAAKLEPKGPVARRHSRARGAEAAAQAAHRDGILTCTRRAARFMTL